MFGQDKPPTGSWRSLYRLPVEKRSADLQWRIIHRAIATNRHIAHLDPGHGVGCPFCAHEESLVHPVFPLGWSAGADGVLGFRFWGTIVFRFVYLWSQISGEKKNMCVFW